MIIGFKWSVRLLQIGWLATIKRSISDFFQIYKRSNSSDHTRVLLCCDLGTRDYEYYGHATASGTIRVTKDHRAKHCSYLIIVLISAFLPALGGALEVLGQQFIENAEHFSHHLVRQATGAEELNALRKYMY